MPVNRIEYATRKKSGYCVCCGRVKDRKDRVLCERCRRDWSERYHRARAQKEAA